MPDSPHLYILEHHKFQLLKILDEGSQHLVALVKNLEGVNLELQLYIRSEANAAMLDRFDDKVKKSAKAKGPFYLNHAAYARHDKYSIICYRQLDSRALIPQFGFSQESHSSQDFELIFQTLESTQEELEKNENLNPLIPALRFIKNRHESFIKLRTPGACPIHQLIIDKNDADLLDICPPSKLSSKEQFFYFRNRLFLYLVCGKAKPVEFKIQHKLSPLLQQLFNAIKQDPLNCQLTLRDIETEFIRKEKQRKLMKISFSIFLSLFILAFVFKDKFFNSDWLGDIYDPISLQVERERKVTPKKAFDERALKNEQQAIINLAEMGFADRAKKRQQLSRLFYKNDADFQNFTFELENSLSQIFTKALQELQRSMENEDYDRAEKIIANIDKHYPEHNKKREFDNYLGSISFKKIQNKKRDLKKKVFVEQELPILKNINEEYQNRLLKPLKNLRAIHDLAKESEDKVENQDLLHLLRCEQLYAKAEYQLFYDTIKQQDLAKSTTFLARHFPQYKTVKKVTPFGFDLDDGSQASYTFFNAEQLADLFISSLPANKRKKLNMALYCYKHKLNELFKVFSEQVKDPKDQKLLEFIQRSVKVRESLMKQSSMEI
ncbi:hypothetical protein LNTAR_01130 [Lentisphaera araneosa HTCC2155]|uniref:Uncharacterized protein n=1 Tax=Lentisphaera araneosa HTCC2155 TaxID=313628 RepID=A6DKR3_9BACT|nr:hypothetical protein [Lentisphaera araneosa]EDM27961.1 hypothetical protein LNTAR_01130 [Lentisphaera araneosa HTCC2155]